MRTIILAVFTVGCGGTIGFDAGRLEEQRMGATTVIEPPSLPPPRAASSRRSMDNSLLRNFPPVPPASPFSNGRRLRGGLAVSEACDPPGEAVQILQACDPTRP